MNQPSNKQETKQQATAAAPGVALLKVIPIGIFIAVSAGILYFAANQQNAADGNAADRQAANVELGLPRDYPVEVVPLYPGVEVLDATRSETKSTDGDPMDRWYIHSQIDSSRKPIFDFYHELMLEMGMAQTLFISVPASDGSGSSFAASYADETLLVELNIEKKSTDEITQLEITVSRLQ